MKIGVIAQLSGFSKDTLRYYEKIGLIQLSKNQRSEHNYRIYDDRILAELKFIKQLKNSGFTLNEIKDLKRMSALNLLSCGTVGPLVKNKLATIEAQLTALQAQKTQLLRLMKACTGDCGAAFQKIN